MRLKLFGGRLVIHILLIPVLAAMCYFYGAVVVLSYFAALLLHEMAHVLVASALRLEVFELELMPFGCIAKTGGFGMVTGSSEIVMAAAGPAVNILIAGGILLFIEPMAMTAFTVQFFYANVGLAAINLLPVIPMDGGRILSSFLGLVMKQSRAIRIVSGLGVAVALGCIGVGAYGITLGEWNVSILITGGFMLLSSIQQLKEASYHAAAGLHERKQTFLKKGVANVYPMAVYGGETLGSVLGGLHAKKYNVVYVVDDRMRVTGTLGEGDLLEDAVRRSTSTTLNELVKPK